MVNREFLFVEVDWKGKRLIWKYYKQQYTEIKIKGYGRKEKKSENQTGCPLSPYFFNIFIEETITILNNYRGGVK